MPIMIARTSINGGYALRALLLPCIRIHFLLPWLTVWLKTSLLYSGRIAGDIFGTSASVIYQADLAARSRGVCLDLALRRFVQWTKNTHILRWLLRLGQHTHRVRSFVSVVQRHFPQFPVTHSELIQDQEQRQTEDKFWQSRREEISGLTHYTFASMRQFRRNVSQNAAKYRIMSHALI